jgi:uncharacterized protein GlcG (DUF336 family)
MSGEPTQTVALRSISTDAAHRAVGAAVAAGGARNCAVAAAVVDAMGGLVAFLRAHGAPFHSTEIAQDKAYTAASFRMPTEQLQRVVEDDAALRDGIVRRDRLVMFAGGLPIQFGSDVVGGIGVSGGSEEMDRNLAAAGLAAISISGKA